MYFKVKYLAVDGDTNYGSVTDNPTPVFSWAAEHSENGKYQSAYRLTVRTEEKLKWDSGWISDKSQSAVYAGESLKTGEELFWTVQIKDNDGNESTTDENFFVAVFMEVWTAEWITTPWDTEREAKYFRKQIAIEREVKKAYLYICGIGYQYVTLNGLEVDDAYLQPAISNYAKHCYYVTLPVKDMLHVGDNVLEVVIGEGWRRNNGEYLKYVPRTVEFFGQPKLTAELCVEYDNGEIVRISTDESWMCGRGPIVSSNLFDGEMHDERVKTEYTHPSVVVTEAPPEMKAQTIRPIRNNEILLPVVKTKVDNGYVFDFGTNIAGIVEVLIPAEMPEGTEVKIYHVENIAPDGSKDAETIRDAKALDVFICGGEKKKRIWRPRFVYHGFRYIYVAGWHDIPESQNFKAIALSTDIKNKSFFKCGSPVVNQIQECILQTEKNNLHSIATDCPQRDERMGWLNDTTVRFEEMPYNFNMRRLFSKIMDDITADQSADGAITCTAPYVFGNRPADPVSSSFLIAALENYLHYGSMADIEKHYEHFEAWNECLKAYSEDGIVTFSHYGDWAGPADCCVSMENAGSVMTPGILMSTGYHYYNYKLLQKFAEIRKDVQAAELNKKEAERVQKAFLEKWWNGETGIVDSGSAGSQAFALWLGILPKEKRELAAKVMHEAVAKAGYRITTGNLNTRYVMDMLAEYGYVDTAWKLMTREEYPSWGYMLQNGATTVWERFEFKRGSGMNSHDHPMYGSVGYWLYSHIAGIRPGEEGWQNFKIQPYLPKKLLYAEAGVETPFGMIYLKWQKQAGYTDVLLDVPFGTTAEVKLPWGEQVVAEAGYHSFHHQEGEKS
ncbi:MAG: family 78 glycoside hydrolase catalytic domain [Roseburia sp.]|nr:family 78 glycoside hydrolase catalytic domain [Roseburia sp.]